MAFRRARFFVVRADDLPRHVRGIGIEKHRFLRLCVSLAASERFHLHGAEFPLFERILRPADESQELLLAADGEPKLDELDAAAHQHAFEFRRLAHEFQVVLPRKEHPDQTFDGNSNRSGSPAFQSSLSPP